MLVVVVGRKARVREEMQPVGSSLLEQEEEGRRRKERSSPNNSNRHRHNRRQLENTEQGMQYFETSFFLLDRSPL